jgi:hypothetical protein
MQSDLVRRAACALAMLFLLASSARGDVREISDAEREAVQIVASYLASGSDGVVSSLSASSPLRALPAAVRAKEIEARLGPAKGARWKLITVVDVLKDKTAAFDVSFASGVDDTIFFDLVKEGQHFRLNDIRILAMPVPPPSGFPAPAPVVASDTGPDAEIARKLDWVAGIGGIAATFIAALMVFTMPLRPKTSRLFYTLALLLGLGAFFLAGTRGTRFRVTVAEKSGETSNANGIAELAGLRNAIATGEDGVVVGTSANRRASGLALNVGRLWRIQWDFRQGNLEKVARGLDAFPMPSRTPLVEVLRARLALVRNDGRGAAAAYERAVDLGPGRDSLWLEAAAAQRVAGFEDKAKRQLSRVAKLGSREAWIYYAAAGLASEPEAVDLLLGRAWTLQPAERTDLVAAGLLWSLMRKRGPTLINLSEPHEPAVASAVVSTRAIALPPSAKASVSGELLHVALNGAELYVPAGASLAPAGVSAVDAGQWTRLSEERALLDAPGLLASPPQLASYMQPALRDRITSTTETLAKRNRWSDVVTLTQGIATKSEFVPPELFFHRARALQHLDRDADAKALLVELVASPVLARKRDAAALEGLGDLLASYDLHALATTAFERAKAIEEDGYSDVRLAQIGMDQRLATKYTVHRSTNFEVRYPPEINIATAAAISEVLEAEFIRLQRWIPVSSFKPVTVNIVWWQDFKNIYTGSENILGFYNGKITLPLAGVWSMQPEVVALITHELAHAMLAQATNDQAPRWMHEGLAQRVEMVPYAPNAFNMYENDKLLAVSVLDAVLNRSRDGEMVGAAYVVSQTFVRYLEENLGEPGVRSMIAKFGAGATTEEAIAAVSGKSLADYDAAFRTWGKVPNRMFENPSPVRYDEGLVGAPKEPARMKRESLGKGVLYPTKAGGGR